MRKIFSLFAAILFAGSMMADSYVKVTEAPTDWSGDYLIVYEGDATHDAVAFNGGLETLDANSNNVAVTITDGVIAATDELNAAKFTIAAVTGGYSVQAANGKFIGATSYANSLATADEAIVNNLSITDGNAVIGVTTSGGDVTLRYNYAKNTWRFRYYKSGQQAVALYKFVASQGGGEDPQPAHTYTVAGDNATLFGTTWAPTNEDNDMTLVEGLYTWEKTNQTLPAGSVAFKVCEDHAWTNCWPSDNYVLNIPEGGVYTITITYNPEGNVVAAVAQKTGSAVVIPTVAMHGNFGGQNWADTENFAVAEGNETASLTLNLAAGDYEFGMRIGGAANWTANGAAFTRENNSAVIEAGQGNITLDADAAGEYTFTWTFATNTLTITYPEFVPPTYTYADGYYLIGLDMQDWTMEYMPTEGRLFAANPDNEGEYQLTITLAADQQFKVVSVQKDQIKAWYPDGMDNNYVVDAAHAGEKTVYFRPDGQGGEGWHYGVIYVAANEEQPEQPEMTAIYDWTGEIGTTVLGAAGVEVTTVKINTNTKSVPAIKFGSSYAYADGKWLAIKPANGGFKAGDVLSVAAVFNNADDTKYAQVDVYAADGATRMFRSDSASTINGRTKADDPIVQTYTLASDQDSLLLGRYGNTSMFVTLLKVERAAGEEPEQPEVIVLPVVKLAGSLTSWEEPVLMANAEDSLSATLTLNLGIDHYQLKVVSDGNWLSKAGDGDLYTMHRDWNHVDHLDLINTGDNIKLITDVEGAYTFTWTYADSTLVVTFPEAPAQPKFYITGNEDIVGEGNPTWGKNGALESFSDTLVMNLAAGFHKFKLITPAEQWLGMEALTDTAYGLFTDDDTNICFNIAEAGEVTVIYNATEFKVEGNFYIAPVAKYYLIGDSAFVVDAGATADKAWTPDAIASFNDTTVLNLKAGVDYIMRLSLNGTWENHRDFRHLTDTAAGLIELPDEYGNHSIGFQLAEDGPVTIIYIPAAEEQPEVFKLIGDFYVAPAPDPTVSVFGTMTDPAWEVEVPFTLSDDKSYATLTVDNIGAGEYNFKFFVNGEWRSNGYRFHRGFPGCAGITGNAEANMTFEADVDGEYTFYWFFANDSLAITYPELPFACDWENIAFLGDGSPEQTHGNQFKLCKEGDQPGVVNIQKPGFAAESGIYVTFPSAAFGEISLPEGTYAIQGAGMILYCSAFTEEYTEVTVVCDNNPIVFTVYNAAAAVVPDPTVSVMGSMNDWAAEIPFTLSDDKTYASLTVENIGADEYEFKFIINGEWRSNGYRFHREFTGAAGITENNDANMVFVADQDGQYTFYWYFANDSLAITYPEYIEPVYTLTNGYYLVGKFGGVDAWSVEDLSAEKLFAQNPDNNAEYQLAINLAVGDEIKVVEVENDAIKTWFPADGDNYLVDGNHAGATTMYFRPDYQGGEGWHAGCIFVVPTGTVDITNIDVNAPAVKAIRNGQFIIIKGEKTYNAQGTLVK